MYVIMGLRLLVYIFLNKLPHNLSYGSFVSKRSVVNGNPHLTAIVKSSFVFLVIGGTDGATFIACCSLLYRFLKSILILHVSRRREVKLTACKVAPPFLQKGRDFTILCIH